MPDATGPHLTQAVASGDASRYGLDSVLSWSWRAIPPAALLCALILASLPATPAAASWKTAGLSGAAVSRIAVDQAMPGLVYAIGRGAVSRTGLMKSVDGGRSWFVLERGLPAGFQPHLIAISPDENPQVLVAGADGVYRSISGGVTWARISSRLPSLTAVHFDVTNGRRILAGTELGGNFLSLDGGTTWQSANRGLSSDRFGFTPGGIAFAQDPGDPKHVFMATNGFDILYRSNDSGTSWHPASSGLPRSTAMGLTFAGGSSRALFVLFDQGLWRSADLGASWQQVSGLPAAELRAILPDPTAKESLFVASERGVVFRSTNGGASWVEIASLPRPARTLASMSTPAGFVLAAAAGEGVWQLPLLPTLPASAEPAGRDRVYYPETRHNISPTFFPFFQSRGGLERFGYPRTEEFVEEGVVVQYFQRARLEYRPEHRGTAYEVQISLLGRRLYAQQGAVTIEPFESSPDQRYFEETGQSVSYAFLRFFNTRGGIDSLGFPISEEFQQNGRPVQYFQRARLEYYAEHAGTRDEVQVAPIGDEILRQRGWLE
jgi:photosystem II stability/assembly factor-like uncharacterized protein